MWRGVVLLRMAATIGQQAELYWTRATLANQPLWLFLIEHSVDLPGAIFALQRDNTIRESPHRFGGEHRKPLITLHAHSEHPQHAGLNGELSAVEPEYFREDLRTGPSAGVGGLTHSTQN